MQPKFYLLLFTIFLFFTACDKSETEQQNSFETSFKAWQSFKKSSNNSYRFVVVNSTWTGSSWQTILTVESGEVTSREFRFNSFYNIARPSEGWNTENVNGILSAMKITAEEFQEKNGKALEDELQWREEAGTLGSNKDPHVSPLITLDTVYDKARNVWLKERDGAIIIFETMNNGLISSCGSIDNRCQDDCFSGIRISLIEEL